MAANFSEINIQLSNIEFLKAIFGDDWEGCHITAFREPPDAEFVPPSDAGHDGIQDALQDFKKKQRWRWLGGIMAHADTRRMLKGAREKNTFFVISTFDQTEEGEFRRRKALHRSTPLVVVDDVGGGKGAKISWETWESFGLEPSYVLETSAGNYQIGLVFDEPCTDGLVAGKLLDLMVDKGLSSGGKDPGMKGVTRYVRLPVGRNNKKKYPEPFEHRLCVWQPEKRHSISDICSAFGIDYDALLLQKEYRGGKVSRVKGSTERVVIDGMEAPEGVTGDDWLRHLRRFEAVLELGIFENPHPDPRKINSLSECPNAAEHTVGDEGNVFWYPPGDGDGGTDFYEIGGLKCHHGHCTDRNDLLVLLDERIERETSVELHTAADDFDEVEVDGMEDERKAANEREKAKGDEEATVATRRSRKVVKIRPDVEIDDSYDTNKQPKNKQSTEGKELPRSEPEDEPEPEKKKAYLPKINNDGRAVNKYSVEAVLNNLRRRQGKDGQPGAPTTGINNVKKTLQDCNIFPTLRLNELTGHIEADGEVIDKKTAVAIKDDIDDFFFFDPPWVTFEDAMFLVASQFKFNPVRDYLESLKWDHIPRLDRWLADCCEAQGHPDYLAAVGKLFFLGPIWRAMEPGCKLDTMIILEGRQGSGKSTMIEMLTRHKEWYAQIDMDLSQNAKAVIENSQGLWIIECDELSGMSKSDNRRMKSFLSRSWDRFREAYGRRSHEKPRSWAYVGTTNESGYLEDSTGNRRYLPVRLGEIDMESMRAMRDVLWAEAYALYKQGDPPYIKDQETLKLATREQEKRLGTDPWDDDVIEYVRDRDHVQGIEVAYKALGIAKQDCHRGITSRIAKILRRFGWEKKSTRVGGTVAQVFVLVDPEKMPGHRGAQSAIDDFSDDLL